MVSPHHRWGSKSVPSETFSSIMLCRRVTGDTTRKIMASLAGIKQAVLLINGLDTTKFPRLLSRILQKLHLKDEHSFNEEEREKLQAALSLEKYELRLVLETVSFILEQAAYYNVKPTALQQQLENIHLNQEKAEAFSQAWTNMGQDFIEKLRQNTFAPKRNTENIFVEFNHGELLDFYNKLETIQAQLDSLT
ncbi:COMM domain-containing protein 10 isoform X1 [Leucoraja erinacea]|uniref:COMM domain-containing protein 10 isoform X1 n=1 Tax=Leucoraja erinaceus TaxID=7782 RepID=UPI002457388E|nr:COMM domain-containing protein 10 isoform X1 [Leucoraja erinacea]